MNYINGFKISFACYCAITTLIFFIILNDFLFFEEYSNAVKSIGVFFVSIFIGGFLIGYFDKSTSESSKQSFVYHLITFITVSSLSIPWFLTTLDFNINNVLYVLLQTSAWAVGLFFHWLFTHRKLVITLKKI